MSIQSNFPNLKPTLLLDFANTKQLDSRVTFTRSTPAVYYDGRTTTMAEQNLLFSSQVFTSGWAVVGSITGNSTTAPDGTTTASTFNNNGTTGNYVYQASSARTDLPFTFSMYLKASSTTSARLYVWNSNVAAEMAVDFNLSTGAVTATSAPSGGTITNSGITSVGNGWYRCWFSGTYESGNSAYNWNPTVYALNGTALYIWGAQIEQRNSLTAYTATTSQAITNYIPVLLTAGGNQPRFDCNPTTGESLGLLIEEQRTNLVFRSVYAGANWTGYGATLTQNYTIAPDASQTACQIFSTGFQTTRIDTGSLTGGTTYAASIWMKSNTSSNQTIALQVGDNLALNCTVTPQWQRFTGAVPPVGSGYNFIDLEGTANDISVWGAQLEQALFATSYIPTTGSAATRTVDSATMTDTNFSSWFNNGQGTFYAEQYITNVTAGSANNQAAASLYKDSNNFIATGQGVGDGGGTGQKSVAWVQNNNSTQFFAVTGNFITVGSTLKNAVAYETNNFAYSANTQTLITDSAGAVPSVTTLGIGFYPIASYYYANNPIRKIAYYPIRVTNAQLQALTT